MWSRIPIGSTNAERVLWTLFVMSVIGFFASVYIVVRLVIHFGAKVLGV